MYLIGSKKLNGKLTEKKLLNPIHHHIRRTSTACSSQRRSPRRRNYDGLGKLNEETVNGATKSYYYTGASNQPDDVTLPNDGVGDILNNVDLQVSEDFLCEESPN